MSVLITCVGCAPAIAVIKALLNKGYRLIGIDMTDICAGRLLVSAFHKVPKISDPEFKSRLYQICQDEKVKYIFPTNQIELEFWAQNQECFWKDLKVKVFTNTLKTVQLCGDKKMTYQWCQDNAINYPELYEVPNTFPFIAKPLSGAGSVGVEIIHNTKELEFYQSKYDNSLYQKYIIGDEYTVDVLVHPNGEITAIVPKKRLEVRNGQAVKSMTVDNPELIEFVKNIIKIFNITCTANVQVIKEKETNKLYLIEINAKFATSLSLTVESGVNIPLLLIQYDEGKNAKKITYETDLIMVRCFEELYIHISHNC